MLRIFLLTVAWNSAIATVVAGLLILFGVIGASTWLETWIGSMIYSQLVGTTTSVTMSWLGPVLGRRKLPVFIAGIVVALTATAFVGTIAANLVFAVVWVGFKHFWLNVAYGMRISLVVTFIIGFVASLNGYYQKRLEIAEQLATAAKLHSLESLVHPHFLFNTLNSISSLTHVDPDKADRMIEQMSALLRYSLDSAQGGLVEMEQELKIVGDYLGIQKVRFGERLIYSIEVAPETLRVKIPPMAIQTLVENSVKHTIGVSGKQVEVRVRVSMRGGLVDAQVSDSGAGFDESKIIAGHGLDTLRARLEAAFGGRAALRVDGATVRLELPA